MDKNSLITAYLACFPDKTQEYAESYFSDLEQYKFIVYEEPLCHTGESQYQNKDSGLHQNDKNNNVYAFVIYRIVGSDEAEIIDIGVIPEKQKHGFGAKILNEMEFALKKQKVKKIHLELREDNFPAEKLYRKLGYIKVGERKGYYLGADSIKKDAVLMTKFI